MTAKADRPDFALHTVNVASPRIGAAVLEASDDFFGAKERLIQDAPPVFIPDKYDDHGKWMDGWESRRRRDGGHDWCVIKLGVRSRIRGVEIDTSHFTGNFPPGASIEACASASDVSDEAAWRQMLARQTLNGDARHFFEIADDGLWEALRLNIFPDGGVARLRVFGEAAPDWSAHSPDELIELSALRNGGRILAFNDSHYGDVEALLSDGRGKTMGDGWETRRRREPGNDWIIIALGAPTIIEKLEIDTAHFKGNFPDRASVAAARLDGANTGDVTAEAMFWPEILPPQKLSADHVHQFTEQITPHSEPVTHVKLNIYPDGGVSRFRVFGRLQK